MPHLGGGHRGLRRGLAAAVSPAVPLDQPLSSHSTCTCWEISLPIVQKRMDSALPRWQSWVCGQDQGPLGLRVRLREGSTSCSPQGSSQAPHSHPNPKLISHRILPDPGPGWTEVWARGGRSDRPIHSRLSPKHQEARPVCSMSLPKFPREMPPSTAWLREPSSFSAKTRAREQVGHHSFSPSFLQPFIPSFLQPFPWCCISGLLQAGHVQGGGSRRESCGVSLPLEITS